MNRKEILKWVTIWAAAGLFMLITFPVASLHCNKTQDVCTITSKSLIGEEQVVAKFYISQIVGTAALKKGNSYYPSLFDKRRELYKLEVFPSKTKERTEEIIQHILNDEKYDIEGSFFKIINKDY